MKRVIQLIFLSCFVLSGLIAQNEVELIPDGIVVPRLATAPSTSSAVEGQFYYNTTSNQFQYFDGTTWKNLVSSNNSTIPYKIEDLSDGGTYIAAIDKTPAGLSDDLEIGVDGNGAMSIDQLDSKDLRIRFKGVNRNTVLGDNAAELIDNNAIDNVVIGSNSMSNNKIGNDNVVIGSSAAENDSASSDNVVIGSDAAKAGFGPFSSSVVIGTRAGMSAVGGQNVLIGYESGKENVGVGNVFIGYQSGRNMGNISRKFLLTTGLSAGLNNPLIYGDFSTGLVRVGGDLEILPEGGLPLPNQAQGNSHIKMLDSEGNMDEILRRSGSNNDVVFGDVDSNNGNLHLRANGGTLFSVLNNGAGRFWPRNSPPGTCNSAARGQIYFDDSEDRLKACGKGGLLGNTYAWYSLW